MYEGKEGLHELFKEHYASAELHIKDIHRKEIAQFQFGNTGQWHRSQYFADHLALQKNLTSGRPPAGLFASSAYYMDPNERVITRRDLIKFDFIIDLDEYIPDDMDMIDFIEIMRLKTKYLVDRFLLDLGFKEEDMMVDFSGNKGFHITFESEEYAYLDQADRRQIIGYIVGDKLDRSLILPDSKIRHYGWNKQVVHFLNNILLNSTKDNLERYFTKSYAKKINSLLADPAVVARLQAGSLVDFDLNALKKAVMKEHAINVKSIVDKGCTTDKHRIFRVPGSLHAKRGLPSVRLDMFQLDSVELIIDEIMRVAGEDEVEVNLLNDVEINFPRKKSFEKGKHTMPRYEALCAIVEDCKN